MPHNISSYVPSPVVAFCQRCNLPIRKHDQSWRVADDNILCPYFNARKLVFCSKDCLERTTESVLTQIKDTRTKRNTAL